MSRRAARHAVAWATAAAMALLLAASLTGEGEGAFGLGVLRAKYWSWLVLLSGATLLGAALLGEAHDRQEASA